MPRSKLNPKIWESIGKRYLAGESASELSREFKITEGAIRKRFSTKHKVIKKVAKQLLEAEQSFDVLPIGTKIEVRTLVDKLRSLSDHLASAAEYGAMSAHRLSQLANVELEKIDETRIEDCHGTLLNIAMLTKTANGASEIGINILKANQDVVEKINKQGLVPAQFNVIPHPDA